MFSKAGVFGLKMGSLVKLSHFTSQLSIFASIMKWSHNRVFHIKLSIFASIMKRSHAMLIPWIQINSEKKFINWQNCERNELRLQRKF